MSWWGFIALVWLTANIIFIAVWALFKYRLHKGEKRKPHATIIDFHRR